MHRILGVLLASWVGVSSAQGNVGAPAEAPRERKPGELLSGEASFVLAGKQVRLTVANGSIEKRGDDILFWGSWRDRAETENNYLAKDGQELQLAVHAQRAGPIDTGNQLSMAFARVGGTVSRIQPFSTCTFTLSDLGEGSFAGEGSCTSGLVDANGNPGPPITGIRFSGRAK